MVRILPNSSGTCSHRYCHLQEYHFTFHTVSEPAAEHIGVPIWNRLLMPFLARSHLAGSSVGASYLWDEVLLHGRFLPGYLLNVQTEKYICFSVWRSEVVSGYKFFQSESGRPKQESMHRERLLLKLLHCFSSETRSTGDPDTLSPASCSMGWEL